MSACVIWIHGLTRYTGDQRKKQKKEEIKNKNQELILRTLNNCEHAQNSESFDHVDNFEHSQNSEHVQDSDL